MEVKKLFRLALGAFLFLNLVSCAENKQGGIELKSEADLKGLTISCGAGSYYERKFSANPDVEVFACNSEADAIQAVRQGLADVYVSDEVMLTDEALKRLGMKLAMRGEEALDVAFALRKGDSDLQRSLNEFLASAPIESIISYWMNGGPEVPDPNKGDYSDSTALRCICAVNMEPISFVGEGNEWSGMDVDILRRFANSIGRNFTVEYQALASAVIALQTGQADVVSGCLFVTDERKVSVDFSDNYYTCRPGYFVMDKAQGSKVSFMQRLKLNLITEDRWKMVLDGLLETLKITILSILLGTILGVGVCAAKRSRRKWLRDAAGIYGAFIAGIPTLVLLLVMFYVVFAGAGISASLVAIVTFALCFASAAGNIFDTAVSSVPKGQTEAGLSLGFTPYKTFTGIVFPQALKKGLPLYIGECISLLKNTSIVGYIAIQDLTRASDLIRSRTFDAAVPLLLVTVLYFVLAWIIRKLLNLIFLRK